MIRTVVEGRGLFGRYSSMSVAICAFERVVSSDNSVRVDDVGYAVACWVLSQGSVLINLIRPIILSELLQMSNTPSAAVFSVRFQSWFSLFVTSDVDIGNARHLFRS